MKPVRATIEREETGSPDLDFFRMASAADLINRSGLYQGKSFGRAEKQPSKD
jgi:hypothetical protein